MVTFTVFNDLYILLVSCLSDLLGLQVHSGSESHCLKLVVN